MKSISTRIRLTITALACLVAAATSTGQDDAQPLQVVINGERQQPHSLPIVVDGQAYADALFFATALGATAAAEHAQGTLSLSHFGRQLALASGAPIAPGGAPLEMLMWEGRLYAPVAPVLAALGMEAQLAGGQTLQIIAPRPQLRGVTYQETDARYTVAIELTGPAPYQFRPAGADSIVTFATGDVFIPPALATPLRDSRGNLKPVVAPEVVTYDVKGALGAQVLVANIQGPAVRVAIRNRYAVPTWTVYSAGGPPRIILEFEKTYELLESEQVAPGIEHRIIRLGREFGPLVAHCIIADMTAGPYRLAVLPAGSGAGDRAAVSTMARASGALVACNGGYFAPDSGHPLGLVIRDREWIRVPLMNRTALLLLDDGRVAIGNVSFEGRVGLPGGGVLNLDGINQWLPNEGAVVVLHTPRWGTEYIATKSAHMVVRQGQVVKVVDAEDEPDYVGIPADGYIVSARGEAARAALRRCAPGQPVTLSLRLAPELPGVRDALGGGPRLVHQGRQWVTGGVERFRPDITDNRSPRTALGVSADGKIIMVVADGRQPGYSMGLYLEELAQLMISLGAVEAMAFDSGGSAALAVGGQVVNSPSDGRERPVPNGVGILPAGAGGTR